MTTRTRTDFYNVLFVRLLSPRGNKVISTCTFNRGYKYPPYRRSELGPMFQNSNQGNPPIIEFLSLSLFSHTHTPIH